MPTVVPVKFKYVARDLWFDPGDTGVVEADNVICRTERGLEIGMATADPREITDEQYHETAGDAELRSVERVADEQDLDRAERLADKGEEAFSTFRRLVHESGLDMKPVGVEYVFSGGKVVCYFSAEERVDFRKLVRDLSHELHEHVDMRQIGVREEAAIIGGFGHCGQELCCARFGRQFEPVSIRMAKEQDLPLNSSKISGACGRLMCCLRYEFEAYRDFKQRAPKRNAVIQTPLGKAKIVEYDTPKEQIALRLENGKTVRVPLSDMTASEAAHKKSEELGCPCRPDTVTRDALERLNSPDVQMALAELDRANGVIPPEPSFREGDLFVDNEPSSTGRRHRRKHAADPSQQKAGSDDGTQARPQTTRHRRHRKAADAESAGSEQERAPRRRQVQDQGDGKAEPDQAASQPRHRRRHHQGGSEGGSAQQPQRQAQAQSGKASASGQHAAGSQGASGRPNRRHRHPGDRGGQAAQGGDTSTSQRKAPSGQGGQHQGSAQGQRKGQGSTQAQGQAQPQARRRRRHHRGNGSGSGSDGSGSAGGGDGSGRGGQSDRS